MFILLTMLSVALAEPPVRDSYLEAAQFSHDQAAHDHYLPTDLTVPSARISKSFNPYTEESNAPIARSVSQEYGPPRERNSLSKEYGVPAHDASTFRNSISQEYGVPATRISQQYDSPNFIQSFPETGLSQRYNAPSSRTSLSTSYSVPSQRSSLSSQYGGPRFRSNDHGFANSPIQKYGVPRAGKPDSYLRSTAKGYSTPEAIYSPQSGHSDSFSSRSTNPQLSKAQDISPVYGAPARSISTQYGTPIGRVGTGFGDATSRLSGTYGTPLARNLQAGSDHAKQSYARDLNTNAFTSSYSSARAPSLEYGPPNARANNPTHGYSKETPSDQGYEYARNALEQLNQEPANYEFAYKVSDDESGSDFGHTENRQLDRAEGAYFVLLPDGTKQIVEYEADENGFKPRISVEPADTGYAREAEGPY